jgi:phosphoesterase RecJ-like protein
MIEVIEAASNIVLVAHEYTDADTLGSACAFYSYLLRLQKKVTLFCVTPNVNHNLSFLPWVEKITNKFPADTDLAISFDCGSFKRLGIDYSGELINFDHHISNERYGTYNCIDTEALSTTQVLYEWFVAKSIKINGKMANALYAGLIDDTHCLSNPSCTHAVFEMAHSLIKAGANHAECVDALFHSRSLASLRLKSEMLRRMKIVHDGRVALFEVDQALFETTGGVLGDCKIVVDEALGLKTVQASLLVAKLKRGGVKISLRSNGTINASKIVHEYGGGGHRIRAGARIADGEIEDTVEKLLISIKRELNETQS